MLDACPAPLGGICFRTLLILRSPISYLFPNPETNSILILMNEGICYWIELSDYDLETAKVMLESSRYLYVGFMCHQAIEKIFKALYLKQTGKNPPHTHNLSYLAKKAGIIDAFSESQADCLDILEPLNIEARYPSQKERLFKSLNHDRCCEILNNTMELQAWAKTKL